MFGIMTVLGHGLLHVLHVPLALLPLSVSPFIVLSAATRGHKRPSHCWCMVLLKVALPLHGHAPHYMHCAL